MNEYLCELSLGDVDGPTVAIKDSIDIAGYPTIAGSRALADTPPAVRHADVVERLLDAGWHIVAKANMHELAFGMTGINDYTGTPLNPQDPSRIPGGSSSGSAAAVGRRLVDAALGTDTGVDPRPRGVLRHHRTQADFRARVAAWRGAHADHARLRRPFRAGNACTRSDDGRDHSGLRSGGGGRACS